MRKVIALLLALVLSFGYQTSYGFAAEVTGGVASAGETTSDSITIRYSSIESTNETVIAYLDGGELTITNNEGERAYTFIENGQFEFCFIDATGEPGSVVATVTWIDKTVPTATITYSYTGETNMPVTATISFDEQPVVVTNNDGECSHTFDANGEFSFEFTDAAGNKGTALAVVGNIYDASADNSPEASETSLQMAAGGTVISGTVLDATGLPQVNTYVRVNNLGGGSVATTRTDELGGFQLSVSPGSYHIGADIAIGLAHTTVWYGSQTIADLSTPVTVDDSGVSGLEIRYPEMSSIAGRVLDASGDPLIGAEVQARNALSSARVAYCETDSEGNYRLLVPVGSYKVWMSALIGEDWVSMYAPHTFHQELATVVDVTATSPTEGVDIEIPAFTTISGRVTDAQGSGVADVSISVVDASVGRTVMWDTTDAQGCYTVHLPEGSYRVRAAVGGLVVYTPDKLDYSSAESINVTSSQPITGVNIVIPEVHLLSGHVLHASGSPVTGAYVSVVAANGNRISSDQTDGNGRYEIAVPNGTYWLGAGIPTSSSSVTIWLGSTAIRSESASVTVDDADIPGLDIISPAMTSVEGTVHVPSDLLLEPTKVWAHDAITGTECGSATVDTSGHYALLLPPGNYWVAATVRQESFTTLVYAPGVQDRGEATVYQAALDCPVTNADILVPNLYQLSGRVLDSQGQAQSSSYVRVVDPVGQFVCSTRTNALGEYRVLLPDGSYRVGADILVGSSTLRVWYGGVIDSSSSSPVSVAGSDVSDVDVLQPTLVTIAGRVLNANGDPLIGVEVQAHNALSLDQVAYCDTDSEGNYCLLVPPGSYMVWMSALIGEDWVSMYAPHTFHHEQATVVDVTTTSPADGVDIEIPAFTTISGRVTDAQGSGVADASILVVDTAMGRLVRSGRADSEGYYGVSVPAGSYNVSARVGGLRVYSPSVLNYSSATLLVVAPEQPVTGADIAIPEVHFLSGCVLDASGLPVAEAHVNVVKAGGSGISSGQTDANGLYRLAVPNGTYWVGAEILMGDSSVTIWLGSTPIMPNSESLLVDGEDVCGMDISIPQMHQLTGRVLDSDGQPQSSSYVLVVDQAGQFVCSTRTNALGGYCVLLPDGSYRVGADTLVGSSTLLVWYGGTTDSSSSPIVNIAGTDISDTDILPPTLVSITGQVTDFAGQPLSGIPVTAYDLLEGWPIDTTNTDDTGYYTLSVLPGGYKIAADLAADGASFFWYGDVPGINEALIVEAASAEQADIHCAELISVSGTVLDSDGAPIVGQEVFTYPLSGGWRNASAETDAAGHYTLNLPVGQYKLGLWMVFGSASLEAYRGGGYEFSSAAVQNVCEAVENWDIEVPLLGTVSGVVASPVTGPLSDESVSAIDTNKGVIVAWSRTDSTGAYTLHLPEGHYLIRATISSGSSSTTVYAPGTSATSAATTIDLGPGGSIAGCDILVPHTQTISGRVLFTAAGQPQANATVSIFDNPNGSEIASATMDSFGDYELSIFPGTYYLAATLQNGSSTTRIWSGPTGAMADAVPVSIAEQDLTNANITIPNLYQINGCMTDVSGDPMANDEAMAVEPTAGAIAWAWTDENGAYNLLVPSGDYYVLRQEMLGTTLVNVYAPGTTDYTCRTVINVDDGAVSGVDMQVPELVKVSGQVTDADGNPVSLATVQAFAPLSDSRFGAHQTDENGSYSLYLPVGSYQIAVIVPNNGNWNQFFMPGCLNATVATTIDVLSGSPVSGADICIPQLYPVTGTVYVADGTPLADVTVMAGDVAIGGGAGFARTDASGQFSFSLPAGAYRFNAQIVDGTGWLNVYHGEDCFGDVFGRVPAVEVSGPTTGVDIHYPEIGWISGRVLDGQQPVVDALVVANESSGRIIRGLATSDADGYYCMPVPAGHYELGMYSAKYSGEWLVYAAARVEARVERGAVNITLGQELMRAALAIPAIDVGANVPFTASVNAVGLEGLRALELRLDYDPDRLLPIGVRTTDSTSGFLLESNLSQLGAIIIAMASDTPISGDVELLHIDFEPIPGVTGVTSLDFALATLNDGALLVAMSSGSVTVRQLFDISGQVTYCETGSPVPGVDLSLTGLTAATAVTDSQGAYSIVAVPAGEYALTPAKSDDVSGITAHDAALILMATVEKLSLSAAQQVAADVDGSGRVGAMDASYVLQHAVGLLQLPFPDSEQVWAFLPGSRQVSGTDTSLLQQDFTAVLIGDVSGNWSGASTVSSLELDSPVSLAFATTRVLPGESVMLPLSIVSGGEPVYSADLSIRYDPAKIVALSLVPGSLPAGFSFASNDSTPGLLRIGIASSTAFSGTAELLELLIQPADLCGERIELELIQADVNEAAVASATKGQIIVAKQGDVNLDNLVTIVDLSMVAIAYGGDDVEVDLNGDGVIDLYDLVSVARVMSE